MTSDASCRCGCGRIGANHARGLVDACYQRLRAAGLLYLYPPPPSGGPRTARLLGERGGERAEDYAELRDWGLSRRQAAQRMGVTLRQVDRYAAHLRAMELLEGLEQ